MVKDVIQKTKARMDKAVEDLRREHDYSPADVQAIHVAGTPKMATVNYIPAPTDLMMAQYSLPFNVALAHYANPRDPQSFSNKTFNDPAIRALALRVTASVSDEAKHGHGIASTVTVTLNDGRKLVRRVDSFKGTPEMPLDAAEMRAKFLLLTRHCNAREMERLFDRLQNLENERNLDWVKVAARTKARRKSAPGRSTSRRRKAA